MGFSGRETRQALAYNLHEDLLPVLTGLETVPESRALWEELELLLQECLPFQVVSICLEGRFPFVGCLQGDEHIILMSCSLGQGMHGKGRGRTSQLELQHQAELANLSPALCLSSHGESKLGHKQPFLPTCECRHLSATRHKH